MGKPRETVHGVANIGIAEIVDSIIKILKSRCEVCGGRLHGCEAPGCAEP
jgi:hypothetical protein